MTAAARNGVPDTHVVAPSGASHAAGKGAKAASQEIDGFEFGGTPGACALIIWSHAQLYYFWYCMKHNGSSLYVSDWSDLVRKVTTECAPTARTVSVYVLFIVAQALLALVVPGHSVLGYPLKHLGGVRLSYCCNGLGCWTLTLACLYWVQTRGLFDLSSIVEDMGQYMTAAILVADFVAIGAYFGAYARGTEHRMTGYRLYDFFMGAPLNPRVARLDLKMFTEARVSWILLFILSSSAALLQLRRYGRLSGPMCFMLLAHGLYTHTIMRGEEGIPVTWDIFYEKWGWMLIFWNMAGVPFTYCYQSLYLASVPPFELGALHTALCLVLLLGGYVVWDVSNSQRCYFRMQQEGTFKWRVGLFLPWLPGRLIESPEYIQTEQGSKLLVSGWWGVARKVNYTADIAMALSWGLVCGFGSLIPYFYVAFFLAMIVHRAHRDQQRCAAKYGQDWVRYVKRVPYTFVPGIY